MALRCLKIHLLGKAITKGYHHRAPQGDYGREINDLLAYYVVIDLLKQQVSTSAILGIFSSQVAGNSH